MNVDMNVDDLLKEIEAKRKSQAAPMRRLEDVCRDCANAYVHMDRARLASLKQELYPFSTATVPSRKAKSKDRPKDTVLNRLTNVLAQRLQIADEGNRALVGTTLEHMKAYKAASTSSHRQLKQRQDEAQAAENEWNQRADTHAQQLFSQEQTNTLQVESDFQRLQPVPNNVVAGGRGGSPIGQLGRCDHQHGHPGKRLGHSPCKNRWGAQGTSQRSATGPDRLSYAGTGRVFGRYGGIAPHHFVRHTTVHRSDSSPARGQRFAPSV